MARNAKAGPIMLGKEQAGGWWTLPLVGGKGISYCKLEQNIRGE